MGSGPGGNGRDSLKWKVSMIKMYIQIYCPVELYKKGRHRLL